MCYSNANYLKAVCRVKPKIPEKTSRMKILNKYYAGFIPYG